MAVNLSFIENDEEFNVSDPQRHVALNGATKNLPEEDFSSPSLNPTLKSLSGRKRECSKKTKNCRNNLKVADKLNTQNNISHRSFNSPSRSNQRTSAASCGRFRRKAFVDRDVDNKSILRQKLENTENSFSDTELCVRSTKNNRTRANPGLRSGVENRQPSKKTLEKSDILTNCHEPRLPCERPVLRLTEESVQPCAVITNPYSEGRHTDHSTSGNKITGSSNPNKLRKQLNFSDTVERGRAEEVKRPKSHFHFNTTSRNSPVTLRRKNPYTELVVRRNHSDKETSSTSNNFPPTNRLSDPIDRSWSNFRKSNKFEAQSSSARPSVAGDRPHSVMIVNSSYTIHQDSDHSLDSDQGKGRDVEEDTSSKQFDAVVFDMLKVHPDEYAKQLTLLDLPVFKAISPDELSGCGWIKKEKWKLSPNVCAMTQRFNNTSFWVIREILNAATLKTRAEILTHFIKIAKKLYELNNLHSLMAIIQSLNSSSIIRLSKTWALITKSHKSSFDRLLTLVKEDDNRSVLRAHMEDIKLPCIPFLGVYLSDVMFIDSAYPSTGGIESHERRDKMNNILRVISEFQQSKYEQLQEKSHILNYLKSVKYIEELEKFVEEDNYKLSLKIEPPHPTNSISEEKSRVKDESHSNKLVKKIEKGGSFSRSPLTQPKLFPNHRKSKSLGKEISFDQTPSSSNSGNDSAPKGGSLPRTGLPGVTTSLLDDSVINVAPGSSSGVVNQTNRNSATNNSAGTSYSNSGSDHSDDSVWRSKQALARFQLLSRKSKSPLKWFMANTVYQRDKPQRSIKSSTYPFDKKSPASSVYHSYLSSDATSGSWKLRERTRSSLSLEMDEFIDMRIRETRSNSDDMIEYSKHCDKDDDGATLLPMNRSSNTRDVVKSSSKSSLGTSVAPDQARNSVSNISLGLRDQAKAWKQFLLSPKTAFRRAASSRSEFGWRLSKSKSVSETMFAIDFPNAVDCTISPRSDVDSKNIEKPVCKFESCVRRKCVLKQGRKPTISTWTRYWLCLYDNNLVYFAAKGLKATERSHFKSHPCKVVPIQGWMLLRSNDLDKQESFQLSNPESGTIYRFLCDSSQIAVQWMSVIESAIKGHPPPERDLINLDDS